jgi:PAS domain S-box-containing protein
MPVFDTSGRFCGYRGVGRDITEKAALQRALAESEERIRLATEFGSIGTWGRDLVTGHPSWSRNMGPILGFLEGTVLPSVETFLQVLHPDDRERFESERLAWLERGGEAETEYRVVCPDGTIRWIYQRGSVEHTTGARPLRMFGIVQDITERKRAELALRESEERFRLLAENVPEVFWISTPDFSRVLYVSPAYEQVWGRSRAELYRHPEEWLAAISQEDRPRLAGFLKRQGLGLPAQVEGRILRADGSMRWVWAESFPFASSAGERLVTGIVHDVTERKREQERKLKEATQQRDALVREVHHRIKNNLQGVAGLLRQYAQRNPGLVGVLETAIAQVQSIAIVHGLQGARDPSAGVVLCDIVAAIAQMLQRLTQARIELPGVSAANRGTRLAGDEIVPTALVLNELMMNAVKHYAASEGSGAIVVELERDARQARLTVRNPGRLPEGFDFAAQTRVGTGLGLVRALMPANGMSLDIHPIDGQVEAVLTLVPPVILSAGAEGD